MIKSLSPSMIALSITINAASCGTVAVAEDSYGSPPKSLNAHLDRMVRVYADTVARYDSEFLFLKNGTKYQISDHRVDKTFTELLGSPTSLTCQRRSKNASASRSENTSIMWQAGPRIGGFSLEVKAG